MFSNHRPEATHRHCTPSACPVNTLVFLLSTTRVLILSLDSQVESITAWDPAEEELVSCGDLDALLSAGGPMRCRGAVDDTLQPIALFACYIAFQEEVGDAHRSVWGAFKIKQLTTSRAGAHH